MFSFSSTLSMPTIRAVIFIRRWTWSWATTWKQLSTGYIRWAPLVQPLLKMTWDRAIVEQRCQYILQWSKLKLMIWRTSNGQAPSTPSLSIATKVMIKKSKAGIMWFWEIRWHQSSGRGRFRFRSTFWGLLTFVVSWYAWHRISILLWCCHHPPNKPASFLHCFFLYM